MKTERKTHMTTEYKCDLVTSHEDCILKTRFQSNSFDGCFFRKSDYFDAFVLSEIVRVESATFFIQDN